MVWVASPPCIWMMCNCGCGDPREAAESLLVRIAADENGLMCGLFSARPAEAYTCSLHPAPPPVYHHAELSQPLCSLYWSA